MKKQLCFAFASLLLSACQFNNLPVHTLNPLQAQANQTNQANSQSRLFETFTGYLNHSQYDQSGLAEMLMTAKSGIFGKIYDNRNSASRYHLYYSNQSNGLSEAIGAIRLGQDQILYLEDYVMNGTQKYQYYRLGTFQLAAGSKDGQTIAFQLDKNTSLKMKWRGINPMDHDEIHVLVDPAVKPVFKDPQSFIR